MARPKKDWQIVVFEKDKKVGSFKGETLVEALAAAEEKILYANTNESSFSEEE